MNFIKKVIRKIQDGMLQEMWKEAKWMWQYIRRYKLAIFSGTIAYNMLIKDF